MLITPKRIISLITLTIIIFCIEDFGLRIKFKYFREAHIGSEFKGRTNLSGLKDYSGDDEDHLHEVLQIKTDSWQYIGKKKYRNKVFSAYYDDRKESFGIYN